jgi:cytochrome c biogenesis protein CcmG/thiol:disulfide interchange protein DsbE
MKRFLLPLGLFGLLVIVLAVGIQRAPEKSVIRSVLLGKPAPQFVLPVLGREDVFDSSSLRGRWYLLNVWGTWCAECRAEHEMLREIRREGRTAIDWGVYGAPETFLVDPMGTVIHKHVGPLNPEIWQRDFLSRLPAPRPAGAS